MKSEVVVIDSHGKGFEEAVTQTKKVAVYQELDQQKSVRLQLITEELLSLARSITGEFNASFWIETEGTRFDLHLTTKTVMDKEKRYALLSTATSRKNEAAKGFLGKLRDAFEEAMLADVDYSDYDLPLEVLADVGGNNVSDPEWDGYERSVLKNLSDSVKIGIRGETVDVTVSKDFSK